MRNNTIKIHLVLHMAEDILNHGVPQNFNSAFMESAHISLAKDTSRNTQKRVSSFTYQAAHRFVENLIILRSYFSMTTAVAKEPLSGEPPNIALSHIDHLNNNQDEMTGGQKVTIHDDINHRYTNCRWNSVRNKNDTNVKVPLCADVKDFLIRNCLLIMPLGQLACFTGYLNPQTKSTFCAHPNYMGGPWYDCALIRWHQYPDPLPARIRAFIDPSPMVPGTHLDRHL
jgi:hypothetical protein